MQISRSGIYRKILVYVFGSLGDNIVSIPSLRALRQNFPQAELVVLQNVQKAMPVRASEVLPSELVDRYLEYSGDVRGIEKVAHFAGLWYRLRKEKFDAVVYLAISERPERSVVRDRSFFRSCGIRQLFGFHALPFDELYPSDYDGRPAPVATEAVRRLLRIERDGIQIDLAREMATPWISYGPAELEVARTWLSGHRRFPGGRLIAISPGCKTEANQWPESRFGELGNRIVAGGGTDLVVIGGEADRAAAERLTREWTSGIDAAGIFSVRASGALLSLCDAYIGLDTGSTHLAAASGTPCFAIFGERNHPGQWFPAGPMSHMVRHPVPCSGCRRQVCPVEGHPCLTGISVDTAWKELQNFLLDVHEGTKKGLNAVCV